MYHNIYHILGNVAIYSCNYDHFIVCTSNGGNEGDGVQEVNFKGGSTKKYKGFLSLIYKIANQHYPHFIQNKWHLWLKNIKYALIEKTHENVLHM